MKSFQLSSGVQWEIARLISIDRIQGDDVSIAMLNELKGSNVVSAPRVAHVLLPESAVGQTTQFVKAFEQELKHKVCEISDLWEKIQWQAQSPWLELDREEEAFKKSTLSSLGCEGDDPWYGGKVQFIGKLKRRTDRKRHEDPYYITLERPELGPSTRFTRRFGSADFLRIKIMNELRYREGEDIINFLSRPLVLSGNVYRSFFSKETTVFFKRTNEEYHPQSRLITVCPGTHRTSLSEFLEWHNPLRFNANQVRKQSSIRAFYSKLCTRVLLNGQLVSLWGSPTPFQVYVSASLAYIKSKRRVCPWFQSAIPPLILPIRFSFWRLQWVSRGETPKWSGDDWWLRFCQCCSSTKPKRDVLMGGIPDCDPVSCRRSQGTSLTILLLL